MPQLLIFAPCERVIISSEETGDGSSSLITILQAFNAEVPPGTPEPLVVAPLNWFIFTLWKMQPEDDGKSFEQYTELVSPTGKALFKTSLQFTATKPFQRATAQVHGMPVSEIGEYQLVLHLMESGKPDSAQRISSFPLVVNHILPEVSKHAS